ncbi:TolC family protein [Treponema putidum]|uniref:Outer membrane efflux protein n=1 Tax=Treponema putidum TaxID=221027 RepID=A0AAE9MVP3_9SPIR|nr:TolC family protein [Treponema putidum]AIN92842.1 hypothetical protein JO40_00810 [Treponema putidum]TWI74071.1 outer membrane efflux protein [Treponema putidum]UTY33938.1 hypothetical protein E4N74_07940 [Treponema putidum]
MKKFLLDIFFVFILFSAYAEADSEVGIKEFFDKVNPLIEKNPQYKKIELNFNLNKRLNFSEFANWFPAPYTELNTSVSGVKFDKPYKSLDLVSSFGINQRLPLGMNLNVIGKQSCMVFLDSTPEYSYKYNSIAGLNMPLWFMAPSVLPDFVKQEFGLYQKKKKLYTLERDLDKKKLILKTLSAIGLEKILKKKVELLKHVQNWNIEETEKNEVLVSQGKLSILDFSEADKKMRQTEILLFQTQQNYNALIDEIEAMGLRFYDLTEDIDNWLSFFENFTFFLQKEASAGDEVSLLKHQTLWMESVSNFQSRIPNLFISFSADVLPSKDHYPSFSTAFMGYWKDNPSIKWSVSMNLKINLSPLHDDFRLNKNFKILKEINSLDENSLKRKIEEEKKAGLKDIKEALFMIETAKSALEIQKKYFTLAEELYKQGKTDFHELDAAKNLLKETEINYYSERLSYVLKVLQVYNF